MKIGNGKSAWMTGTIAAIVALVAGESRAQTAPPGGDGTVAAARAKYQADQWPSGPRRAGFVLEDLSLPGLTGLEVEFRTTDFARGYTDASGAKRLLVEMTVGETAAEAHRALLDHVSYVESTKTLPTAASRGIRAGDVGYVADGGKDGGKLGWIAFAAGNLEFRVVNLAPDAAGAPDLKTIVEVLTARVTAQPALADGAPLPKPVVTDFHAAQPTMRAGDSVVLDLVASDPTGRAPRFQFTIGGQNGSGAQGYVEQDEQGRYRFFATSSGKATLTAIALGRNGTVATRDLELEVTKS